MTDTFTWLHFSDLHSGSNNAENYWPNIEEKLFPDIKKLLQENKLSIDAILFTGDLVNRGTEYDDFNEFLDRFKKEFPDEKTIFLSVPGNHDLVRPPYDGDSVTIIRNDGDKKDEIRRARKLFCSHYVSQAYNYVGRDLKKNKSDRFMTPDDIATSPILRVRGVLKLE